jgi:hypothetical protein
MQKIVLLACLPVAVGATAAELKKPADVARDWDSTITAAREAVSPPTDLQKNWIKPAPVWGETNVIPGLQRPRDQNPLFWEKGYSIHETPPKDMPRGSRPWQYGGQTYWLVPLDLLVKK